MRGKPRIYGARLPARQTPHSRDMRAFNRPRRCRARPARGFTGKAPCGASPASTVPGSPRGKRRIHGPRERANAPVDAGLARHGVRRECPHAGQAPHLRCPAPRAASAAFTRYESGHAPRRCRARPARGSPGRPHAGQAPHLRNARFPAWQAPHSRAKRAGKRPRRCRARPARGFTGKAPCGVSPASTVPGSPRGKRRIHGPRERANAPVGAGLARHGVRREGPMRGKPRIYEMRAPAGKPRIHGEHAVPWRCVSPRVPGRHCLNAGARPLHGQRAATRRTGRCTCPPLSRGRPMHCRALSARHRRRHAHTQA